MHRSPKMLMSSHSFLLLLFSLNCVEVIAFSPPLHLHQPLQYQYQYSSSTSTSWSWLAAGKGGGGFGANSKSKELSPTKNTNKSKSKLDYTYSREEVVDAMKNHLGLNLDAFDEHGYSKHHEEQQAHGESTTRWSLKLLHKDPPVFKIDNFFTAEECEFHKSLVDPSNSNGQDKMKAVQIRSPTFSSYSISRRTSTTWFCRYEEVPTFLSKAQHLLNNASLSQMEEPQIVRYRTGEEFSWHYDEIPTAQLANGGQRLATLLVYLNDLDEDRGGGTVFRDLIAPGNFINQGSKGKRTNSITTQLIVRPTKGTALLFFPSYKDGTPDPRTLHKGEVALDEKIIAQLWIHERDYKAGVPEGNLQSDAIDGVEEVAKRLGFMQ